MSSLLACLLILSAIVVPPVFGNLLVRQRLDFDNKINESMRAERHSAALATAATTFSGFCLVEAVGDDVARVELLEQGALGVRTAGALHFFA